MGLARNGKLHGILGNIRLDDNGRGYLLHFGEL